MVDKCLESYRLATTKGRNGISTGKKGCSCREDSFSWMKLNAGEE